MNFSTLVRCMKYTVEFNKNSIFFVETNVYDIEHT